MGEGEEAREETKGVAETLAGCVWRLAPGGFARRVHTLLCHFLAQRGSEATGAGVGGEAGT